MQGSSTVKILLAPSESKKRGGTEPFVLESLLFDTITPYRSDLIALYNAILQKAEMRELSKMFGLKKESDILLHRKMIGEGLAMKAIERYTGVAFDYLKYPELSKKAQAYIDTHVILFSNLFGPIRAEDKIPEYRLKQGERVGDIQVEKFYREHSADLMEVYLQDDEILDLRAGFYDKFYKPNRPYTTLKFIKNGKVVSHWAKAYRGIVLNEIAQSGIETIDEFLKLPIEKLSIGEIQHKGNQSKVIYHIDS